MPLCGANSTVFISVRSRSSAYGCEGTLPCSTFGEWRLGASQACRLSPRQRLSANQPKVVDFWYLPDDGGCPINEGRSRIILTSRSGMDFTID